MVYKFKLGSYKGLDAQKTGEELERIRLSEGGKLATHTVWREAKKKSSPLHNAFTWDVDKAAEERWADQARSLIRAVVEVEGDAERTAFINVCVRSAATEIQDEAVERYYQAVRVVASSPVEYESALAASRTRLASAQNALQELLGLASKKAKPSIKRAQKHVKSAEAELAA